MSGTASFMGITSTLYLLSSRPSAARAGTHPSSPQRNGSRLSLRSAGTTGWDSRRTSLSHHRQRLLARAAVGELGEIDRLGEIAGLGQELAHPGELVHRDRHLGIDRRVLLDLVEDVGSARVIGLGLGDLRGELDHLVAV